MICVSVNRLRLMVVSLQGYPARKLQLQHVSHKGKLTVWSVLHSVNELLNTYKDDRRVRLTVRDGRQHVLTAYNIICKAERGLFLRVTRADASRHVTHVVVSFFQ